MVSTVNSALPLLVHRNASLTEINQVHYAAALTIQREILPPQKPSSGIRRQQNSTPKWKKKLTEQISRLRVEASRIDQYLRGTPARRLRHRLNLIKRKYNLRSDQELASKLTKIKLLITTKAKIIKNKEEKMLSTTHNKEFEKDPKRFIASLDEEKIEVKNPPTEEELSQFWRGIYEDGRDHDGEAAWIESVESSLHNRPTMTDISMKT